MAALNVKIPPELPASMQKLMQDMKRLNDTVGQVNQSLHRSNVIEFPRKQRAQHQELVGKFRFLQMSFGRLETTLASTVDMMTSALGGLSRVLLRGFSIEAFVTSPVMGVLGFATMGTAPAALGVFRWLWDRVMVLGEAMMKDRMLALSAGATVGGVRAFRVAFGMLPGQDQLIETIGRTRLLQSSRMASVVHWMLRVKRFNDTSQTVVETLLSLQKWLKAQPRGQALEMAQRRGIEISPQILAMLLEMRQSELIQAAKEYLEYRQRFAVPDASQRKLAEFILAVRDMWQQIENILGKRLAEAGIVDSLIKISQAMPGIFDTILHLPVTQNALKSMEDSLRWLGDWLSDTSNQERLAVIVEGMIKSFERGIAALAELTGDTRLAEDIRRRHREGETAPRPSAVSRPPPTITPGRQRFITSPHVHVPRPAPGVIQRRPQPTITPGRRGFTERLQMPRPPPGAIAPRAPREPTPLRAPTSPAEAPETTEAAVKGGFRRGSGEGLYNRDRFRKELEENPALREKVLRIAANEQGSSSDGTTAIIESMMNRAEVRGTTLEKQARWYESEGGYYQQGSMGRGMNRSVVERSLSRALGGSDVAKGATDNSSGNLAAREKQGNEFTHTRDINGESFFTRNSEDRKRSERLNRLPGDPSRVEPYTTKDIQRALQGTQTQEIPARGPGKWSDLPPRPGHSPELKTVDPRLREILSAGRDQFEARHPGYTVTASSGRRHGYGEAQHGAAAGAVDVMIIGPDGKEVSNKGDDPTGMYHDLARLSYGEMQARYPGLQGQFAWGGAFGTRRGTGGGPPDLMHFDLGGERGRFTQNLPSRMGPIPGVGYGRPVGRPQFEGPHDPIRYLKVDDSRLDNNYVSQPKRPGSNVRRDLPEAEPVPDDTNQDSGGSGTENVLNL